ncbi:MAG: hypothetical protein M9894_04980 [Planctomycetes bacterium]|nr:hypothetical protein [Planctomycetota bacterium]
MDAAGREQLFVQIGVQQRLFTREQVEDVRRGAPGAALAEALVARGVLAREQARGLERAVVYRLGRDEDKRIAQIIVDSGYCPEARVQEALRRQKDLYARSGDLVRLGTLLMGDGALTDSQHIAAAKIFQIERTNLRPGTLEV